MSKLHLLPTVKQYYKAGLHNHTNLSDGDPSPEELKARFQSQGYQIMAITDHEICIAHPELNDKNFLTLNGYELAINSTAKPTPYTKAYHLCLIAKDPGNTAHVCFDRSYLRDFWPCSSLDVPIYNEEAREYSADYVNHFIEVATEAGYLVTYNHPSWSLQTYPDYIGLKGLWGVEVYTGGTYLVGHDDLCSRTLDDLLEVGTRVFPLATDDTHKIARSCSGWLMVGAKQLSYPDVIAALERGDFYASTGPELKSLTLENGILRITCSPCRLIRVSTECRRVYHATSGGGELLTEAELDLRSWFSVFPERGEENAYFRLTLEDAEGHFAWTRAYFRDEVKDGF